MAEDIRTMHEEDEDEVKYCERKRLLFFGLPWTFTKYTITPSMLTIDQGLLHRGCHECGTETDPHQKVKGSQKLSFESIRGGTYETPHIKYTRHWS